MSKKKSIPHESKSRQIVLFLISLAVFLFSSIYITYPLIFYLGDYATGFGDEIFIAWTQNWVIHSLTTNPLQIFDANIYFPFRGTLAYSDLHFISSILASPIRLVTAEPIATFNFTLISSLIFLGISIYLLSYYLTKNFFASLLSGVLILFSPHVLSYYIHVQMLSIQWVPLSILFFLLFIKQQQSKYLFLTLIFFLLQIYNSILPAYFLVFSYLTIFIYHFLYEKKKTKKLITKKHILSIIFALLMTLPIVIPYYRVSNEFNYTRDIRDAIHLANHPEDLLYSSEFSHLSPFINSLPFNSVSQNSEFKPGYIGFVFSLLTIMALYYSIKYFKKKNPITNSVLTIGITGIVLSLGPFLHLGRHTVHDPFPIPLPYALFYYVLPGFQGFRNSARWEMLFVLMLAVLIAIVLNVLLKKVSLKGKTFIYLLLFIGVIAEFNFPMKFIAVTQTKDFPPVYAWLDTTPKDTSVIIMPAYNWNMPFAGDEIQREYFSTNNFRRTVNGYSGFSPPPWQELLAELRNKFPEQQAIEKIKNIGVDYILVDKIGYDKNFKANKLPLDGKAVVAELKESKSLEYVKDVGDYAIFKVL